MSAKPEKRREQQEKISAPRPRGPGRPPGSRDRAPRASRAPQLAGVRARLPDTVKGGVCSCGEPTKDGDKFCGACGKNLRTNECPNCSATMAAGSRFCGACGKARAADEKEKPTPSMADLTGRPAALQAPTPSSDAPPAVVPAQPVVPGQVAAPVELFPEYSLEMVFGFVDKELHERWKTTPLDDKERKALARVWAEVANKRLQDNGPNADIWRACIVTAMALLPRGFAAMMYARREAARDAKKEVGKNAGDQAVVAAAPGKA